MPFPLKCFLQNQIQELSLLLIESAAGWHIKNPDIQDNALSPSARRFWIRSYIKLTWHNKYILSENPLGLFHMSIWERALRKHLEMHI